MLRGTYVDVDSYIVLPDDRKRQSAFFRFDGVGWESDRIAYKLTMDYRNIIEIFGKKIPDMVLQDVGRDGIESNYQSMSDWGMDILKVNEAFGLGAIYRVMGW